MRTSTVSKADLKPANADIDGAAIADRILELVTESLENSKAEDIIPINIRGKSALADYMVIASGRSNRHVNAVCDHLLRSLKDEGHPTSKVEGLASGDWVLIDIGDVIVHVFRPEVREFYALEKMWSDPVETKPGTMH